VRVLQTLTIWCAAAVLGDVRAAAAWNRAREPCLKAFSYISLFQFSPQYILFEAANVVESRIRGCGSLLHGNTVTPAAAGEQQAALAEGRSWQPSTGDSALVQCTSTGTGTSTTGSTSTGTVSDPVVSLRYYYR
jgi:hypothetical protein